jgi:hypothetical protein
MKSPFPLRKNPFLSPSDLLARAFIITLFFALLHLLGGSEYTSFLSGTLASNQIPSFFALFMGLSYIILFIAFTFLVPILIIAALLSHAITSCLNRDLKGARP